MTVYTVVQIGDDILRAKAAEVKRFNENLARLLDDMAETMKAEDGVGLAAPQVGISKRVVVIDVGDGVMELINPVIVDKKGEEIDEEGCLSVKGEQWLVPRAAWVKVEAVDRQGNPFTKEGEGFLARALQHEIDHLDGILFVDKAIMNKPGKVPAKVKGKLRITPK